MARFCEHCDELLGYIIQALFFYKLNNYHLLMKRIYHQLYVLNYLLSLYQTLLATDVIFTFNRNLVV